MANGIGEDHFRAYEWPGMAPSQQTSGLYMYDTTEEFAFRKWLRPLSSSLPERSCAAPCQPKVTALAFPMLLVAPVKILIFLVCFSVIGGS